jgi:hypothetical protein
MSTRSNIIIKETFSYLEGSEKVTKTDKLFFYRHSDGYPDGALPLLLKFMEGINKKIANRFRASCRMADYTRRD